MVLPVLTQRCTACLLCLNWFKFMAFVVITTESKLAHWHHPVVRVGSSFQQGSRWYLWINVMQSDLLHTVKVSVSRGPH